MKHRAEAQKLSGITEKQQAALALGREKGTNHRAGYKHKESSKRKTSMSHKIWCATHPDEVAARGEKTRGDKHYKWNGGSTRLNKSVRTMTEHRRWMDGVKERDKQCTICGSTNKLESHHIVELAVMIAENKIKNRDDARNCPALWDLNNGKTLCEDCHYKVHGRHHAD
jgi:5-methylcytosine-specific restriction endonuclease McrA